MSLFSSIPAGIQKAFSFLETVLTKTAAVDKTFTALAPSTKAAILATFYDVSKTVGSATAVAAEAESGNIPAAITLSAGTLAMIQNVLADGKGDLTVLSGIITALKADI